MSDAGKRQRWFFANLVEVKLTQELGTRMSIVEQTNDGAAADARYGVTTTSTHQLEGGRAMATLEIWSFTATAAPTVDLTGFKVEARDGDIGKVDEASYEAGRSFLVVDTGPWIFGKKVMLPAGVVRNIDLDTETVFVDLTKDEIKDAPAFDDKRHREERYRNEIGDYYGDVRRG